ncbi:DUF5991 domain-containing protein [Methylorubrum suomiense]|uniref:Uncharacterized protein n=1 Tax=Methylorubrum suomiense TaxID=144191 RepID=A0ABQ4UWW8_9HYPH|nr:DUF5991 domain-containing protein [Methylorubrum suomiense]GJE76831.1 hypothetical protein BGCPKDLD_3430 [Methylorubrum suomiense]
MTVRATGCKPGDGGFDRAILRPGKSLRWRRSTGLAARLRAPWAPAMLLRNEEVSLRTTTIHVCLAALSLFTFTPLAAAEGESGGWQGRYRYEHDAGLTEGGSSAHVTYDLVIGPDGARGGCVLTARGFQTDERIICHARSDGSILAVSFHRYEDGRTVNKYGVAVYKPGETLFTLSRAAEAGLLTRWGALAPDGESVSESGAFFSQSR